MKREPIALYRENNKRWLEAKAQEPGVRHLPLGIHYKVLRSGNPEARSPLWKSMVTIHYTESTIDGKTTDTSRGRDPYTMRLTDLNEGLFIALQYMHVGDHWALYVPYERGYGYAPILGIRGFSTLVYEVELLGVKETSEDRVPQCYSKASI